MAEYEVSRFAANLLPAAPGGASVSKLAARAVEVDLEANSVVSFASAPSVELCEVVPTLPARWAVQVASAFSASAADAQECAAAIARDRRRLVRRALLSADELPVEVVTGLVSDALAAADDETLVAAAKSQPATPLLWAEWMSHPSASVLHGGASKSQTAVLSRIASSLEATRLLVSECESPHMAARTVVMFDDPDAHMCDLLDDLAARGDDSLSLLQRSVRPYTLGERGARWLETLDPAVSRLHDGSLSMLSDPDVIRMWWRSNLEGKVYALLSSEAPAYPEVAEVVAEEVIAAGDVRVALNVAAAMCTATQSFSVHSKPEASSIAATISCALDVVEWAAVRDGAGLVAESSSAGLIAARLADMRRYLDEDELTGLLSRLVAVAPGRASRAVLLLQSAPPFAEDVIADPGRFGVSGELLVTFLRKRAEAGLWRRSPELLTRLTVSTPGVCRELSQLHPADPDAVPETLELVRSAVAVCLAEVCGSDDRAWDTVLGLAPQWDGSAVELAEVAATFRAS